MTDPWHAPDLTAATTAQLFSLHAQVLTALRARDVVRTQNPPAGDYAEWLVHQALGGTRAGFSQKSYDVHAPPWGRVQVKARTVSHPPRADQLQTSPFRSADFDHAALLLLHEDDFTIVRAALLPTPALTATWRWRAHVNGHVAFMTPELLGHPSATDLTDLLRTVAARA